nr:NAC domain-containing protein 83-like [Ipomoea batatas]
MEIPLGLRFKPFDYDVLRLKKKGSRVQRTVGKKMKGKKPGTWHGQDTGKAVADKDGKFVMGYKRSFVYKNKSEPEQDGQRLMKEFYLPETIMRRARAQFRGTNSNDFEAVSCPVPVETTIEGSNGDAINSYLVGVPMETAIPVETLLAPVDNMNSYIVSAPVETMAEGVPVETLLAAAAVDGVPVETLPGMDSFMDLLLNMEDVTTLIDFDA